MHPDVVVIGGGIIGCSCAYYLSLEGLKVTLIERGSLASGTSGACEGNVLTWNKRPGIELDLATLGASLYKELSEELPLDIELTRRGCLLIAEDPEDLAEIEGKMDLLLDKGIRCHMLDQLETLKLEPKLSPDIAGGIFFPEEIQVNPMLTTFALAKAAKARGAVIRTFCRATGIELSPKGEVVAVDTTEGRVFTRLVINAAGVWSGEIGRMVGLDIPVLPRKGHVIVTEPADGMIRHTVMEAGYTRTVMESGEGVAVAAVMEPTRSGNILLGSSREFAGFDRSVDPLLISAILSRVLRLLPDLKHINLIRSYAGLRPCTPDRLPIISGSNEIKGFYVATGHEGIGVCLAPITGKLMAQMITGRRTDLPLEDLSLSRFREGG